MEVALIETISHYAAGAGGVGVLAWYARRVLGRLDSIDLTVRGDGNGNKGLGEKIRDVHDDVKHMQAELGHVRVIAEDAKKHAVEHDREAEMWKRRIESTEARCEAFHRRPHPSMSYEATE